MLGDNSDIISWEQSYNCQHAGPQESFARSALYMSKLPSLLFAESATAGKEFKTDASDPCQVRKIDSKRGPLSDEEKLLLTR